MAWLLRDGEVLASLEIADSRRARSVGLLGRQGFEGALLIPSCRSIHTIGMRFAIDVAYCDHDMTVRRVVRMRRFRIGRPALRPRAVIEAEAGMFARWNLRPGDQLEIKGGQ
jgi:uncharacterized membrane protein (UPF0127 family)